MQTERLVDHQIRVEVVNKDGFLTVLFPDGQQLVWPTIDKQIPPGVFYLTLSPTPVLPTKQELARLVLQEILKLET